MSQRTKRTGAMLLSLCLALSWLITASPAEATSTPLPTLGMASVSADQRLAGNGASSTPSVALEGRYIAFQSAATNLVSGDTNEKTDIFVRDTIASDTRRVSVTSTGAQANGTSSDPEITLDGRYVVFVSSATNLVAGDTNEKTDIFRKDLWTNAIVRVSVTGGSTQANLASATPTVSANGAIVAFQSLATNLVASDTNTVGDIFVRDLGASSTTRASVTSAGAQLTEKSANPDISSDGSRVVFESATDQIGTDTNARTDIFMRNRGTNTSTKVSVSTGGIESDQDCTFAQISGNGAFVVFQSLASTLVAGDTNAKFDVFLRNVATSSTTRESVKNASAAQGGEDSGGPSVSTDGDRIAFWTNENLTEDIVEVGAPPATNIVVRDRSASTTSATSSFARATTRPVQISADGTVEAFDTASPLAQAGADASNATFDVYYRGTIEVGPATWPAPLGASFVEQQWQDFYGRLPTTTEEYGALIQISNDTRSTSALINDLAHDTWDNQRGPVIRLYWAFFERVPDLAGLNYWVGRYSSGRSLASIASSFATSSEFRTNYGSATTNTQFVTLVYNNVLDRAPDASGLAYWVGRLGSGVPRGEMMVGFSESSEGKRHRRPETDTILTYLGMLRRLPTASEFTTGLSIQNASGGQPNEVLILSVLRSAAYDTRIP